MFLKLKLFIRFIIFLLFIWLITGIISRATCYEPVNNKIILSLFKCPTKQKYRSKARFETHGNLNIFIGLPMHTYVILKAFIVKGTYVRINYLTFLRTHRYFIYLCCKCQLTGGNHQRAYALRDRCELSFSGVLHTRLNLTGGATSRTSRRVYMLLKNSVSIWIYYQLRVDE